jgi:hypothetical protein
VPVRRIQAESEEDGGVEGTEPGPQEQLGGPLAGMKREKIPDNDAEHKRCQDVFAVHITGNGAAFGRSRNDHTMLSLIPAFSLMDSTFFTGSIISPELL